LQHKTVKTDVKKDNTTNCAKYSKEAEMKMPEDLCKAWEERDSAVVFTTVDNEG
jgi:hypothetical protein